MNRFNLIIIIIGVAAALLVAAFVISAANHTSKVSEEIKLAKGEITLFQICAHIGKAAIDDPKCTEYNRLYGPNP